MKALLKKTNSWHWAAAVLLAAAIGTWALWQGIVRPAVERADKTRTELNSRLAGLASLKEAQISTAQKQQKDWEKRRIDAQKAYDALGLDPLPESAESTFALKNRLDQALAVHGLRILSNEVSLGPGARPKPHAGPKPTPTGEALPKTWAQVLPYPTEAFGYAVAGPFRDMFLFLWTESARKTAYSLKDIRISRAEDGTMQMDFVLQVCHR